MTVREKNQQILGPPILPDPGAVRLQSEGRGSRGPAGLGVPRDDLSRARAGGVGEDRRYVRRKIQVDGSDKLRNASFLNCHFG